jgi:hypothetical protein
MYNDVYHYISTGNYGLLGEYKGIILLNKNYSGPPKVYGPQSINLSASNITLFAAHREGNSIVSNNLTNGEVGWYGTVQFLQPGRYNVTLSIIPTLFNSNNKFLLLISSQTNAGNKKLGLFNISENALQMRPNVLQNVTFSVNLNNFYENVQIIGESFNWIGNLSLRSISITQESYPYN